MIPVIIHWAPPDDSAGGRAFIALFEDKIEAAKPAAAEADQVFLDAAREWDRRNGIDDAGWPLRDGPEAAQ